MAPGGKLPPPAPTTPRVLPDTKSSQNLVDKEDDAEEMDLRSSAIIPAAEEVRPAPPPPRAPIPSSSDAAGQVDVAERVQAILTDVLMTTLAPMLEKQRELEARLEALKAMPVRPPAASIDITGSLAPSSPSLAPVRAQMISTSYGLVSVMPSPAPRPAIEEALEKVGPIDVPDFGGKRKWAGRIVIAILILGVVGAVVAMALSYS